MQMFHVGPVVVTLEKDSQFIPIRLEFKFSIGFDDIIPTTLDEAESFHYNTKRLKNFFAGINRAFVLESEYEETELFVTGRIGNVSIEVPSGFNKMPLFGALLFNKAMAILDDIELIEMEMSYVIIDPTGENDERLRSTLLYNDMMYLGSKLQSLVEYNEDAWGDEIRPVYEDEDGNPLLDDEGNEIPVKPWWRRNDGEVRDLINLNFYEIEDEETGELLEGIPLKQKDEIMSEIKVMKIDIDDEVDEGYNSRPDDNPDDSPENSNGDNPQYYNF